MLGPCLATVLVTWMGARVDAAPPEASTPTDDGPPGGHETSSDGGDDAQGPDQQSGDQPARESAEQPGEDVPSADTPRRSIEVPPRSPPKTEPERASSVVTREQLDERLPRSAPDALRYEPGVYVQQTAHAQASPYVRGMTGQQTALFFDGVRLNNATFRQGPNQYFFTVDSRTIHELEVIRGSASTRYGSDALGGVLLTRPIEPDLGRPGRWSVRPRAMLRTATADKALGGRGQIEMGHGGTVGVLAGVGYRDVAELQAGGPIRAPATGMLEKSPPAFRQDGKTQRGTGFRELTADTRLVWQPRAGHRFTLGYYDYRQFDAPRTDKCPPEEAPEDDCLVYLEQFRTLTHGRWDLRDGPVLADTGRWIFSYQNQHELRQHRFGTPSRTVIRGRDDVHSIGNRVWFRTERIPLAPWLQFDATYGADGYFDIIDSHAWTGFRDVDVLQKRSRGQYLDGSRYLTSGLFTELRSHFWDRVELRGGVRGALVVAKAPGDPETESAPVDRLWLAPVGHGGVSITPVPWLVARFNASQGFRAPNLDDLTSRQQTGPGFQRESPDLEPERSLTLEAGLGIVHPWIELDAWAYRTHIDQLIGRVRFDPSRCPEGAEGCRNSLHPVQLVNLEGTSVIQGIEGSTRLFLPWDLGLRATVAYAWGQTPDPRAGREGRVPASRIPPLNGTVELGWRPSKWGFYGIGAVRWATLQDRLAPTDELDARIPAGGTPGFAVFDLRAGYRWEPHVLVGIVLENLADAAYRYHGSSVNGPGRGLRINLELGF